jgi:hypothetical protein
LPACTFFQFHYQPSFLLNTYCYEFIDWPCVFICFILYVKGFVLLWKSIHNIVHKKGFLHLNLKILIWATISPICMMCSCTSLILVSLMDEYFMIILLASALSEMMN